MKNVFRTLVVITTLVLYSCGGGGNEVKEVETKKEETPKKEKIEIVEADPVENKGVGPVKNVEIAEAIDAAMVTRGTELFNSKCTACHKVDKKFVGPALKGVTERRSPEWIMNMILNPVEMVEKDPVARQLLIDHNGSPMANQNLTEAEARDILEYFRTIN
jgi:mono/diheme cytochrome c family protein